MSIELITGRAGKPHVDSQDVRAYQAYTAGSGRYVLHGAACSVESANEVSITPGEILVDGTHVRVTGDGETVTIGNGQTGYKRSDIVALHYTVTGSGESIVESMEFTVVQGSPSDTEPEDPSMPQSGSILEGVTETYIPYARILIDGLAPQDPEMLVEQYALPIDMGGTGSPSADGARQNLSLGVTSLYNTAPWFIWNNAGYMYVVAAGVRTGGGSWDSTKCPYTIPLNLRPTIDINAPVSTTNGGSTTGVITVKTNGEITVGNAGNTGSSDARNGLIMWPSNGM